MKKLISNLPKILITSAVVVFLVFFLFPSMLSKPLRRSENTHTENTAYQLKNAISAFFREYRSYPTAADLSEDIDLATNHALMDILLGSETEGQRTGGNPRRIAFYTGKRAKPMSDGKFRKGIVLQKGGSGELFDPWGNFYRVRLDADLDSRVKDPSGKQEFVPESILIWSAGKDGDYNTWNDNLKTW